MDIFQAPEIRDIAHWINSEPLTIESLRGKVILVDFWTYSCINCIRTQPYLNAWHEKYEKDGLVIIGIHAPEFAFEKVESNVREASKKAGIKYPVALDNDFATWNAYGNRYWPAKYLIDQNGIIVYKHFGEGNYTETELKIQELL
jgi:thiol-disulfide isomerase/thioredoxin